MLASLVMNGCFTPAVQGLNPVERLNAARGRFSGVEGLLGSAWVWIVVAVLVLAILTAVVAYLFVRSGKPQRPQQRRRGPAPAAGPSSFDRYAEQARLSEEERRVLTSVAELAGLKRRESVFMLEAALEKGAARFAESDELAAMPAEKRKETLAHLESLRQKLGAGNAGGDPERAKPASSRQIPAGTTLTVVGRGGSADFEARLTSNTDQGMEVETQSPVQCNPGDVWLVRYDDGSKTWQFDAAVRKGGETGILLAHTKRLRFHDRRRFVRIPVRGTAYVAGFPFIKPGSEEQPPELLRASLVEMGGVGLKLEAPITVQPEDSVLVALKLTDGRAVQGLGKVRRVFGDQEGRSVFAVELIGLKDEEVAELVRETTESAKREAGEKPADQVEEPEAVATQEG